MIVAKNISKVFNGKKAVDNISFTVTEGQTLVLLGTSGCGKTTTLRMINRLIEPASGELHINGQNVLTQSAEDLRRSIGYVLQHHGLFPHYTVAENIAIVPKLLGWNKAKTEERLKELMQKLQLSPQYAGAYPNELSGGQQQRVGLARALAADPPILLMDEPFGALDPVTRASIRKEYKELDEIKRKTVVLVTHDVHEAFELANIICLMDKGRIMQIGKPADLLFAPANDFVKAFFSAQRLQLELQSVFLKDAFAYLPPATNTGITLLPTHSLWEAMKILADTGEPVNVVMKENDTAKQVTFAAIQRALNQIKANNYG